MAYDQTKMRRLDGYPGEATYRYGTTDADTAVKAANYFNGAIEGNNLATGDVIVASCGTNSAAAVVVLVAKVVAGNVTTVSAA